jgi:hypothetical protein
VIKNIIIIIIIIIINIKRYNIIYNIVMDEKDLSKKPHNDPNLQLNLLVNKKKVYKPNVTKVDNNVKYENSNVELRKDRIVPDASLLLRKVNKNKNFFKKEKIKIPKKVEPHLKLDDNWHIIQLLKSRMKLGAERYGHGIRVYDDTRKYGTKEDSWEEIGLEEMLDGLVYLSSAIIRRDREKKYNTHKTNDDIIYDSYRKNINDKWFKYKKTLLL